MSQIRQLLPSLNTLVAFEAAVRCGTFARAAKELGVTSPAVSRTIGRLEVHLGLPLFRRTPAGAVLTDDGSELFSVIDKSLQDIEGALVSLVGRNRVVRKPIVLSVSSAFATHWFMPRLAKFQSRFPGEQIHFQLVNDPLAGSMDGVDIAMRFDPKPDKRHEVFALMPELLLPVHAPHYEGEAGAGPLSTEARTITLSGSQFDLEAVFSLPTLGINGDKLQLSDYTLVVQAALAGQGIAVGWLNVVSNLLAEGALVPATPTVVPTGRRCDLVIRGTGPSVLSEICDWILDELREDVVAINARYGCLGIEL
jgi:LysR family transcriptional regulator, glycine cleavage system transcriptional activator